MVDLGLNLLNRPENDRTMRQEVLDRKYVIESKSKAPTLIRKI